MVRFKEDGRVLSSPEVDLDFRCQFLVPAEEVPVGLRLTWVMMAVGRGRVGRAPAGKAEGGR
jgi:hypothetical protein